MTKKRTEEETTDATPEEVAAPATSAPTTAPAASVRTAEQWAETKGMLPEFIEVAAPFARADAPRTRQHNPQFWRFAATRAGSGWPIGKELTEAEFDAAVEAATTQTYR